MTEKDSNHALRLFLLSTKRSYRDNAKSHLGVLFDAMVDGTLAFARSVLGLLYVLFSSLALGCKLWQGWWVRKPSGK